MGCRNTLKFVLLSTIFAASLGQAADRYLSGVEVDVHNFFHCVKQKESQNPEGALLGHPPACDPYLDRLAYSWNLKRTRQAPSKKT